MSLEPSSTPLRSFSPLRMTALLVTVVLTVGVLAWRFDLLLKERKMAHANSILVIQPYRADGTWVFDDESAGLVKEPFVAGVPEMIDVLVKDIPNASNGFRLLFSAQPFPGHQKTLMWLRGDLGGNYYSLDDPPMEGWLCPALFKYYDEAPANLFIKAEAITR